MSHDVSDVATLLSAMQRLDLFGRQVIARMVGTSFSPSFRARGAACARR